MIKHVEAALVSAVAIWVLCIKKAVALGKAIRKQRNITKKRVMLKMKMLAILWEKCIEMGKAWNMT